MPGVAHVDAEVAALDAEAMFGREPVTAGQPAAGTQVAVPVGIAEQQHGVRRGTTGEQRGQMSFRAGPGNVLRLEPEPGEQQRAVHARIDSALAVAGPVEVAARFRRIRTSLTAAITARWAAGPEFGHAFPDWSNCRTICDARPEPAPFSHYLALARARFCLFCLRRDPAVFVIGIPGGLRDILASGPAGAGPNEHEPAEPMTHGKSAKERFHRLHSCQLRSDRARAPRVIP